MNDTAAPTGSEIPLTAPTVACIALMRLAEMTPESAWEAMGNETRKDWLQVADTTHAYSRSAWRGLPPETQRKLRLSLRWINAFLASAGADLLG